MNLIYEIFQLLAISPRFNLSAPLVHPREELLYSCCTELVGIFLLSAGYVGHCDAFLTFSALTLFVWQQEGATRLHTACFSSHQTFCFWNSLGNQPNLEWPPEKNAG